MATIKVYNECCRVMRKVGYHRIVNGEFIPCFKPDMKILGFEKLVSEIQLMSCSESEKRRHLHEDDILRCMYIELESHFDCPINRAGSICSMGDSKRISKVSKIK